MLTNKQPIAAIAVRDIHAARRFYERVLGLKPSERGAGIKGIATYDCAGASLLVYRSELAGTNQATGITWPVGDEIDAIVTALKAKGVTFETYDVPGGPPENSIYTFGPIRTAWFKDPDGNIHGLVSG